MRWYWRRTCSCRARRPTWSEVNSRLRRHNVDIEVLDEESEFDVEMDRLETNRPVEGRFRVSGEEKSIKKGVGRDRLEQKSSLEPST